MGPHRKRQRLSEDGAAVASSSANGAPTESTIAASSTHESRADDSNALKHRRQLFVRGLGTTVTTDDLTDHFSQSFPIKHAVAVLDKESKHCKGYGFVTFADAEDAARAKDEFDGSDLQGRKIKVDIAEPRHRDPEHGVSQPAKAAVEAKKRKEEQMQPSQSKLIIRNLPWSIKTEDQLSKLFLSYGKIKKAILPKKSNGMLAGYGFVTLRGRKNAEKALEAVNGKEIDGRTLAVDWSVEKETWQKVQDQAADDEEADEEAEENEEDEEEDEDEDEEADEDNEDDDDDDDDEEEDSDDEERYIDEEEHKTPRTTNFYNTTTLFIRNLPFTCTDEDLEEHFEQFGGVRYARVVIDRVTEKPKGTGFVCFFKEDDAITCLKNAPKQHNPQNLKDKSAPIAAHSVLQNTEADPTGQYTMDGRVLNITKAVERNEAEKLTAEGVAHRYKRDNDKRKLYLLSEGTIPSNSPLYKLLSPAEIQLREASVKQRKNLIESNPSLHMSLTRLSVRNIPRTISSKDLKQLARQAIVGFAKDMKEGKRSPLSQEELRRGDDEMREADKERRKKGKGVVKQAKIVFENKDGTKVSETSGAGRSRGYGFIEYYTHRHALMGLRWLNCHAIDYQALETTQKSKKVSPEDIKDRKKRLIVEFAIENAQVVQRRKEMEAKMREKTLKKAAEDGSDSEDNDEEEKTPKKGRKGGKGQKNGAKGAGKRKRGHEDDDEGSSKKNAKSAAKDEKLAKQSRIIARKRQMRRARNKGVKR